MGRLENTLQALSSRALNEFTKGGRRVHAEVSVTLTLEEAEKVLLVAREFAHQSWVEGQPKATDRLYQGGEHRLVEALCEAKGRDVGGRIIKRLQDAQRALEAAVAGAQFRKNVNDPAQIAGVIQGALHEGALDQLSNGDKVRLGNMADEQARLGQWVTGAKA